MVVLLIFHTLVFISCAVYVIITCIYGGEWGSLCLPREYCPPLDMPDVVLYRGLNNKQLLRVMKQVTPMRKKIEVYAGKKLTLQGVNRVLKAWRDLKIPAKFRLTITWSPKEERLTPDILEKELLDELEWIHGEDHLKAPMNTSPRGRLEHSRLLKNYKKAKVDKGEQDKLLDAKKAELEGMKDAKEEDREALMREIVEVKDQLQECNMHIRNYNNQTQNFMPIYEVCYDGAGPRDDDIYFAYITYRYMPLEWQTMHDLHLNGTLVNDIDDLVQAVDVTDEYKYTEEEQKVVDKDNQPEEPEAADRKPAGGGDGETTTGGGGGGGTEAGGADTVTGPLLGGGGAGGGGTTADGGGTTADGGATTTVGGGGADAPLSLMKSQTSDVKSLMVTKKSEAKMARRNIITILAM